MPRRREVPKRRITPDPKFKDKLVAKFLFLPLALACAFAFTLHTAERRASAGSSVENARRAAQTDSVTLPVPEPITLTRSPSSWRRCNEVTSGSIEPWTSAFTTRFNSGISWRSWRRS